MTSNQQAARELVTIVLMEPIFPHFDTCCICERDVQIFQHKPNYGIPLYEEIPVPPEWEGEWGGFCACKECHDKYERGELRMWTIAELEWVARPSRPCHPTPPDSGE